jgi:hypothetical protein
MNAVNYHIRFEELIETYMANGLTGKEKSEFEQHNTVCDTCRKSLDEAQRFAGIVFQAFAPDRSPEGLENRLIGAFRSAFPKTTPTRRIGWSKIGYWSRWAGAAAAALVLFIIGGMVTNPPPRSYELSDTAPAGFVSDSNYGTHEAGKSLSQKGIVPQSPMASRARRDVGAVESLKKSVMSEEKMELQSMDKETGFIAGEKNKSGDEPSWTGAPVADSTVALDAKKSTPASLAAGEPLNPDRKIIKSGMLTFEVESFETAYQKVVGILAEEKGYIAASSTTKLANGKVRGEIIIRIVPEHFDSVTLKLRSLGELKNQQVSSEDITKQYVDLTARVKNAKALEERLVKLMTEKKGEIKDLLEVEKELANTREKIERLQGEIKYYDNLTSLATITLDIMEKDISKPFEYVQTQSANLSVAVSDVSASYQKAQGIIHELKGQIVEGNIADQDKRLNGSIKAFVDAEQFAGFLEQLKALGEVKYFNATQRQTSSETNQAPAANTPVRKERGLVVLSLTPPAGEYIQTKRAQIILEVSDVDNIYAKAQNIATDAQAKILSGNLNRGTDQTSATLVCQIDAERFRQLMDSLKAIGKVQSATTNEQQQAQGIDTKSTLQAPVRKDPGIIEVTINSPSAIVTSEHGIGATLKKSISGLLWSIVMITTGAITVGPWIVLVFLVYILYRWLKKPKAV